MQDFTWKAAGVSSSLLGKLLKDFQIGQLEFQLTSVELPMTSSEQRFEELEKDLIQLALIEMMEMQLIEMDTER